MRRPNRWYVAIQRLLEESGSPLTTGQIWEGMEEAGFQHASKAPRSTLGARLAEMAAEGVLERVGPSSYRLRTTATAVEGVA